MPKSAQFKEGSNYSTFTQDDVHVRSKSSEQALNNPDFRVLPDTQPLTDNDHTALLPETRIGTKSKRKSYAFSGRLSRSLRSSLSLTQRLDEFFALHHRRTDVWTEIRSGLVTFFTMAYILVVNAQILSLSGKNLNGISMDFSSVLTATALSSALSCIIAGLLGNLPFGLAPGMGLNSYFTYGVCLKLGLSWNIALTASFFTGVLFFLLSVSGLCTYIQSAAPQSIKKGITIGLGLLQALIGLEMIGAVIRGEQTLLEAGDFMSSRVLLGFLGILLIAVLLIWNVNGAMLVGLTVVTICSWVAGHTPLPEGLISVPTLAGTWNVLDFPGFFSHWSDTFPVTFVFLFVAVLDTAGVHFALGCQNEYVGRGLKDGSNGAFIAASVGSAMGALMGTSPVIIHNESCAGIQDGGRTGLSAVSAGFGFLFCLPFLPIFRAVPDTAAAAPLFIVGMLMMGAARYVNWSRVEDALPAFATLSILPLTYSIAHGMAAGIAAFAVLKPVAVIMERYFPDAMGSLDEGVSDLAEIEDESGSLVNSASHTPLMMTSPRLGSLVQGISVGEELANIISSDSGLCFSHAPLSSSRTKEHHHQYQLFHGNQQERLPQDAHALPLLQSMEQGKSSKANQPNRSRFSPGLFHTITFGTPHTTEEKYNDEGEREEKSEKVGEEVEGEEGEEYDKYSSNSDVEVEESPVVAEDTGKADRMYYPHSLLPSNLSSVCPYVGGRAANRGEDPYGLVLQTKELKKTVNKQAANKQAVNKR